jgi:hypothetical protein
LCIRDSTDSYAGTLNVEPNTPLLYQRGVRQLPDAEFAFVITHGARDGM